jgi:hypothetical protein
MLSRNELILDGHLESLNVLRFGMLNCGRGYVKTNCIMAKHIGNNCSLVSLSLATQRLAHAEDNGLSLPFHTQAQAPAHSGAGLES